jgi:hypothetical protein
MMGRYSLDEPGLIYAHAGNVGFDATAATKDLPGRRRRHRADHRRTLVRGRRRQPRARVPASPSGAPTHLEENMAWLAESLGTKGSETPDETIRRYLADKFFKDHLQTYKKRPIYWLFSSGKQGAFQALVYLHRYHEGTLARMRAEYVVPLTGKMQARIEMLETRPPPAIAASLEHRRPQQASTSRLEVADRRSTSNCWPTTKNSATTPTCASARSG